MVGQIWVTEIHIFTYLSIKNLLLRNITQVTQQINSDGYLTTSVILKNL